MANLSIGGKNFNPDKFLEKVKLKVDSISYKGQPINKLPNARIRTHSFVYKKIYNTNFNDWDLQIKSVITYLKRNRKKLLCVREYEGVQFAGISLILNSKIYHSNLLQSFYFPTELIKICAELNLDIETTLLAPDLQEKMENYWKPIDKKPM